MDKKTYIYIANHKTDDMKTKFGHRTEESAEKVIDVVEKEFSDFRCYATYEMNVPNIEKTVSDIRKFIKEITGNLKDSPEYNDISYDTLYLLMKVIAELRGELTKLKIH